MSQVLFTPDAINNINDIWEFIAQDSSSNADKFISKMYDAFEQLANMPFSAKKRPELGGNIRSRPYGNYVIFYEPLENKTGVLILNILWGGRDIDTFFN